MKMTLQGLIMLGVFVVILHLIYTMWKVRNADALKRQDVQGVKRAEGRSCYHGIARHDPDWEV